MSLERRSAIRIKKALDLQYLADANAERRTWVSGVLRDISETGISFTSDKNFLAHQIISIRIRFPFNLSQWIELKARCVNSRSLSIGIYIIRSEFTDLQVDQKKAIKDYLVWALAKQKENK